jgi:hypothetical protein
VTRRLALVGFAAAAVMPVAAEAHLAASGLGPVYDGVAHFFLSPEDLAPVAALGLYIGLRGPKAARIALAALPLAWLVGEGVGLLSSSKLPLLAMTAGLLLLIGGMLAANFKAGPSVSVGLGVVLGLVRGCADAIGVAPSLPHGTALAGMAASAATVLALAASLTLPARRFAFIVAARVAGSWMAALGLLLAGWIWRFGARAI